MAITTGIDIVNVARIKKIIEEKKQAFLARIFSDEEIAYCETKVSKHQHYAARFAAKEAFIKALPDGEGPLAFKDIEVCKGKSHAPSIRICNEKLNTKPHSISLSISHEKEFAVAIVVLEYV